MIITYIDIYVFIYVFIYIYTYIIHLHLDAVDVCPQQAAPLAENVADNEGIHGCFDPF